MKLLLGLCVVVGCYNGSHNASDDTADAAVVLGSSDPLNGLPTGTDEWTAVCAKHYGDVISQKFCATTTPPSLTSLADLEALLGLTVQPNPNNDPTIDKNVRVTFNGESTGLGLRAVGPLNPRVFLMTPALANGGANPNFQVMAFARGEPMVELVANDPAAQTLRFFLVRFHPACEPNCTYADQQTPTIESGWTGYTLYDDATIKNTTLDCLNCHQPSGPTSPKLLRMQELANPWAHWFYPERPDTLAIVQAFQAAHPTEDYGGVPYQNVMATRPAALMQVAMNNGFATQPNAFPSLAINNELAASGTSATWASLYAASVAGTAIPVPYDANAYDPTKLQAATTAYQQTMAGTLPRDQMPDISDVFLDSAKPAMSIRPAPGLDGKGILAHMCRMCHNSQLDQSITRARFNVDTLDQLDPSEKQLAIQRLMLPDTDAHHMPPTRFHELADVERQLVIDELSR